MQTSNSSIADVIVGLQGCLYTWKSLDVSETAKEFCILLTQCSMSKFDYELNYSV